MMCDRQQTTKTYLLNERGRFYGSRAVHAGASGLEVDRLRRRAAVAKVQNDDDGERKSMNCLPVFLFLVALPRTFTKGCYIGWESQTRRPLNGARFNSNWPPQARDR